ncbi:MAG: S26 family signal peptidase [Succinatimonas hippei]|nr:S26 family signal peptidase [Succinatimonas hippei]
MNIFAMSKKRRLIKKVLFLALCISTVSVSALAWGVKNITINLSPSLPGHVYLRTDRPVTRGAIVNWCPEDPRMAEILRTITPYHTSHSARCPSGEMPLLKIVRAMPGDEVVADGINKLKVNGEEVISTTPNPFTPLPRWTYKGVMPEGEILLYGLHPDSFDSRYVGMFDLKDVESVMVEIF